VDGASGAGTPTRLDAAYEAGYVAQLRALQATPGIRSRELALFWPAIGARYSGELLVVGRAVNGSNDQWLLDSAEHPARAARRARLSAEADDRRDPLGWVLDRWKARDGGYDTSSSQFWEATRRVVLAAQPDASDDWASRVAWTNLAKVAPWQGGNPGSRLRRVLGEHSPGLLRREVEALKPTRVVVFAGRSWFEPFAGALGLEVEWRDGHVEGVANDGSRRWVIAVHPMTRSPKAVADAVSAAWSE
jgi:hypothetical protein